MSGTEEDRRINGWQYPYHPLQVVTWILFPVLLLQYFLFLMPLMWQNKPGVIGVSIVFGCSSIIAAWAVKVTCQIDPVDDALVGGMPGHNSTRDPTVYCYLCEANVFCDKCVMKFDHHCKWLNTCIGAKNYRYFLTLVASIGIMTTLCLVVTIYYIVEAFVKSRAFENRLTNSSLLDGVLNKWTAIFLLFISLAVLLPLVALVFQLGGFHTMLVYKNITTYDFIVMEQKRVREQARAKTEATRNPPSTPPTQSKADSVDMKPTNATNASAGPSYSQLSTHQPQEDKIDYPSSVEKKNSLGTTHEDTTSVPIGAAGDIIEIDHSEEHI